MIKQFSAGDITIRPFGTFKHWTIQSVDSASVDVYGYGTYYNDKLEVNLGLNLTSSFFPTSSAEYSPVEIVNTSGKYARNVYSMTNAMFYRFKDDPLKMFGVQESTQDLATGNKEIRNINDRIVVGTLKHNVYGDSLAPTTIRITDNSNLHETYEIYDDGYTNLRLSGSHFPTTLLLGAVRDRVATPYWITSSGEFYVHFDGGSVVKVSEQNAKYYADMGLVVDYLPPPSGSDWAFDQSTARDWFQSNNEHFGESVSSWYKYIAVGSSMDNYNLSARRNGYVALFKYDEANNRHRLLKKINFPFTQSAAVSSSYFQDSFGYSVAVRDDFLAVGSPTGQAGNTTNYPGYVCVYDKHKGGTDFWGIINLLRGESYGDHFGNSVSIDNDILAVGAPGVSGSGAVYIFRRKQYMDSGSCDSIPTGSTWHQVITATDFVKELETSSFHATQSYTPTFVSGNYSWQYETMLTASVTTTGDNFGWCLEVSDDRLIVGTYKSGQGYAALFTCSYSGSCPTASWSQVEVFVSTPSYGDLDRTSPRYLNDVSNTITSDLFGSTVSINGDTILIGCPNDKKFLPYATYAGTVPTLGAAYFYHYGYDTDCTTFKTFGQPDYLSNNNFAKRVSVDGNVAAIAAWPDQLIRTVDYTGSAYVLENYSYQSTGSEDSVLGRVFIYKDSTGTGSWSMAGDLRRNKESFKPYNIYGHGLSVCSDFLSVGAPLANTASAAHYAAIINEGNQTASMASSYSGSVFVYNLNQYTSDQPVGNVFYKNGYLVLTNTSSNYQNILTGTGSQGFTLNYQGSHTIFEHEYLVSIHPGEFNYSTNPTALLQNPLAFDVNQDGVFDYLDVDLIMRYLQMKKFYAEFVFDDNGIILEQDTLYDYSWWGNDLLQTENEDVLLQEYDTAYAASSSLNVFTKAAFDYIEKNLVATNLLDVDGNGIINLNDGSIVALYYFDQLNPTTLAPYLTSASTRKYVKDIGAYLDKYCLRNVSKVNPEFFGYQASSSYDPTGSYLAPMVTTIGLYQDNELVAVGKLGRPIKNLVDWPVNFIVRFDT